MDIPLTGPFAPLTVVLVDPDDLVRQSLTGLLGIGRRVEVVGSAGEVRAALRLVGELQPDVIVVDPRLPELPAGLAFIAEARRLAPAAGVLVIGSAEVVAQATASDGVDGCIRKTFRPDELTAAIVACRPAPG